MHLKDMQNRVDSFISQYGGYWSPLSMMARITEETGELAREVNHVYGTKKRKPEEAVKEIKDELGDMIFTIICLANSEKIDLEEAFDSVMKKAESRDKDRTKK